MAVRKMVLLIAVMAFIVSSSSPALAGGDPLKKLGRGLANCATFPIELPSQISNVNNADGPVAACSYGILKGVWCSIVRAVVGVYEVATFLIPLPPSYEPILTDPEFILESWTA